MEGGIRGLVVVVCAFLVQVLVFGTSSCIGVYTVALVNYFEGDVVGVSMISAIYYALFFSTGPLVSALMSYMTYRKVCMLGSAMVVLGTFCSPLVPSLNFIYVFFGVISGLGSCLVYIPSHTLCGLYYKRHRALSTGIVNAGAGVGGVFMPVVMEMLIEEYTWRGSLILLAGFHLHLFVLSMVMVAPDENIVSRQESKVEDPTKMSTNDQSLPHHETTSQKQTTLSKDIGLDSPSLKDIDQTGRNNSSTNQDHKDRRNLKEHLSQKERRASYVIEHLKRQFIIFTNYKFVLYFMCTAVFNLTGTVLFAFGPEIVVEKGNSRDTAAFFFMFLGVGSLVGSASISFAANFLGNSMAWFIAGNAGLGTGLLLLPGIFSYAGLVVLHFFLGVSMGVLNGLCFIIVVEIVGVQDMGIGLGHVLLAGGIGSFVGPPVFGSVREAANTYVPVFFASGVLTLAGGALMVPVLVSNILNTRCHHRKDKQLN